MKRKLILMFIMLTFVCGSCGKSDVGTTNTSEVSEEIIQSEDVSAKELNPFENLKVTYEGFDGDGKIKIDTSNCSDKVKENVEFSYDIEVDGKLKNNQEIEIYAKVKNEKYTLTHNWEYYSVDGLFVLETKTPMFHDGIAWLKYTDSTVDETYLGAIDTSGKLLFQYEIDMLGKYNTFNYTSFKDGKAMIAFKDGIVGIIDKTGKVLKTIDITKNPIQGNQELNDANYSLLELNNGYCIVSAEVKDFDNNYYVYIAYDMNGKCVFIDKSDELYVMADNVGYDIFRLEREDVGNWMYYFLEDNKVYSDKFKGEFTEHEGYMRLSNTTLLDKNANIIKVEFPFDMNDWDDRNFDSGKYILVNERENKLGYYDIVSKQFSETSEYVEKMTGIKSFKNDIVFIDLEGADKETYTVVFDKEWNILIEPMKMSDCGYFEEGFWVQPVDDLEYYYYDFSGNFLFKGYGVFRSSFSDELIIDNIGSFSDGLAYTGNCTWINTKGEVVIDSIDYSETINAKPSKVESKNIVHSLEGEYIGYYSTFKINADGSMEYMQDGGTYPVTYNQNGDCVWNGQITWPDGRITEIIIYMDDAGNLFVDGKAETWVDEYYRRQP